jgi:Fe-S-cluster-containing dehydrogenase component
MSKILKAPGMNKCIGCYSCMLACARTIHKSFSPRLSAIQVRSRGGLQSKFAAHICIGCTEPPCAAACPTGALIPRPGGGVKFFTDKCDACGACGTACVVKVIHFEKGTGRPVICIQCGTCSRFCPHQCLAMEERENA